MGTDKNWRGQSWRCRGDVIEVVGALNGIALGFDNFVSQASIDGGRFDYERSDGGEDDSCDDRRDYAVPCVAKVCAIWQWLMGIAHQSSLIPGSKVVNAGIAGACSMSSAKTEPR